MKVMLVEFLLLFLLLLLLLLSLFLLFLATENFLCLCFVNWGYNWVLSRIYFFSQFLGVDITFWVRLVNDFLKVQMKTSLFPELYSR